jgi:hypothetical protein
MAGYGPVPFRTEELAKPSNRTEKPDKIMAEGAVPMPATLDIEDAHPLVVNLFEAMKESAQRKYMEPSDWAYAKITLHFANGLLKSARPSGQTLAVVNQMLASLMVTEGDRRRLRIEVERKSQSTDAAVVEIADLFKQRLGVG